MKSDVLVTTGWLIWPSSMFDDDRYDREKDLRWEFDTDGSRLVRWLMIIINVMFLVIMQRWVRYRWLLPISMFDDNNGKVSMIQVALALLVVRDHDHDHDVLDGKKSWWVWYRWLWPCSMFAPMSGHTWDHLHRLPATSSSSSSWLASSQFIDSLLCLLFR